MTAALRVGQKLAGDPLPNIPPLIDRFVIRGSGADERPVVGRAGADPAGIAFIAEGGLHWIGYQSNPYPVALEAPKFEDYLRDEGLERIVDAAEEERAVGGAGTRAVLSLREGAARHAGSARRSTRRSDSRWSCVPRKNPYAMHAPASCRCR